MKLFTRYRILNATRAMVAEVGVERVTMRGIAAMANITAPAIYKHFRNKRELLEEVVAQGYLDLCDKMRRGLKTPTHQRGLRVMIGEAAAYADRYPRLFEMMVAPLSKDDEVVSRLELEVQGCITTHVLQGQNPREAAITLWSQMRGFLARRPEGNVRKRYDASMQSLLRQLATEPEAIRATAA